MMGCCKFVRVDGWKDAYFHEWIDGWMGMWVSGWMEGGRDELIYMSFY